MSPRDVSVSLSKDNFDRGGMNLGNFEKMHTLRDCICLSCILCLISSAAYLFCYFYFGLPLLGGGEKEEWSLNSSVIKLVGTGACIVQVRADDRDDEWH